MKYFALASMSALLVMSCSQNEVKPEKKEPVVKQEDVKKEELAIVKKKEPAKNHWSYEGAFGPQFWASLDDKNVLCGIGQKQSPIDLVWRKPKKKGSVLAFDYRETKLMGRDTGHSIQFDVDPSSRLTHNGDAFELQQLHFHSPSEHTLSGKSFPLEMHFVHKSMDGRLTIVGALFQEGSENALIQKLWSHIPSKMANPDTAKSMEVVALKELLPKSLTHYSYVGSLTTPPCTEGVNWVVLNTPIQASKAQIEAIRAYYKGNNRPIQKLNARTYSNY